MFKASHLLILDGSVVITNHGDLFFGQVNHLTNHSTEKTGLSGSYLANNYVEGALLELDVKVLQVYHLLQGAVGECDIVVLRLVGVEIVVDALSDAAHVLGFLVVDLLHHFGSNLVLLGLVNLGCDAPAKVATDGDSYLSLGVVGPLNKTFLGLGSAVVPPEPVEAIFDVEQMSILVSDLVD